MATLTDRAARAAAKLVDGAVPPHVRTKATICLLDVLGACIEAAATAQAAPYLHMARDDRRGGECVHVGCATRVDRDTAAFGNAAIAHLLIRDDMHVASGSHIGAIVVPALLALGDREGLTGGQLMRGIVAGYEAMARLGTAVWSNGAGGRHFRPSGIAGAFGVAAGAVAALELDAATGARALGIAANLASGVNQWPWSGGQEAPVHMGTAARNGLLAVDLARAGISPSRDVLEGSDGLFAAYDSGDDAAARFAASVDAAWRIMDVRHKPHPGCNLIQTVVSAALMLRREIGIGVQDIAAVTIRTFALAQAYPGCDCAGPFTAVQQSKMSLQFGVAQALVRGRVDEEGYADLDDANVLRIAASCRIVVDPAMNVAFPATQPGAVDVTTRDGRILSRHLPDVPWLDDEGVVARFHAAAAARYDSIMAQRLHTLAEDCWDDDHAATLLTGALQEAEAAIVASAVRSPRDLHRAAGIISQDAHR